MKQSRAIALGFFDGVHLGHGQLLTRCREEADRLGVEAAALTFDRHPAALLRGKSVPLLSDPEERGQIMKEKYGIQRLITMPFCEETMNMPWEQFFREILMERFGGVSLICGHDYRFGRGGEGTPEKLRQAAAQNGICCHVIPAYQIDGRTVSSTYIRQLIGEGNMEQARRFLGHPYTLRGKVVPGRGLGRTLGTPTANLELEANRLLPPHGVYACKAVTDDGVFLAVTNIGIRPTVQGHHVTVEPWLLDFTGNLYGKNLTLEIGSFLRPEMRFPDLESLRCQILRDGEKTRCLYS